MQEAEGLLPVPRGARKGFPGQPLAVPYPFTSDSLHPKSPSRASSPSPLHARTLHLRLRGSKSKAPDANPPRTQPTEPAVTSSSSASLCVSGFP